MGKSKDFTDFFIESLDLVLFCLEEKGETYGIIIVHIDKNEKEAVL